MVKGVHNYSEIGRLNKVLLHRIGTEVDGLVPDNFARLLFDDIPYLKVAQQEHDRFAEILKKNGVQVVYYVEEAAKALGKPGIRDRFIREMLDEVSFTSRGVKEAVYAYLIGMTPNELVNKIIAGFADGQKILWCDFNAKLADPDGLPRREYFSDGLHLRRDGFAVWRRVLRNKSL